MNVFFISKIYVASTEKKTYFFSPILNNGRIDYCFWSDFISSQYVVFIEVLFKDSYNTLCSVKVGDCLPILSVLA